MRASEERAPAKLTRATTRNRDRRTKARHAAAGPASPRWPAQEVDGSWDTGLQLWRYGRIMEAIHAREAADRPSCGRPCCADLPPPDGDGKRPREVVIEVPVPPAWRPDPADKAIAAYGCSGTVLTGHLYDDATVLAAFPLVPLRRAMTELVRQARAAQRSSMAGRACAQRPHPPVTALAA